jgi:hypothetical protein
MVFFFLGEHNGSRNVFPGVGVLLLFEKMSWSYSGIGSERSRKNA